jgi:hypothetical protein
MRRYLQFRLPEGVKASVSDDLVHPEITIVYDEKHAGTELGKLFQQLAERMAPPVERRRNGEDTSATERAEAS